MFSNTLTDTNNYDFEVRIAEAVFNGERSDDDTFTVFSRGLTCYAICGIDVTAEKASCHRLCLLFTATGKKDSVSVFPKLKHIPKYASGIKIIFADREASRLNYGLGVKHGV